MARALITLGSNLGDRKAALDAAVAAVAELDETQFVAASSWRESPHVGGPPQGDYLNGAVLIETSLGPLALLDRLQQIERAAGRVRAEHWGPRTLDLDLLLYGGSVVETDRLQLPHPRLAFRRFVLLPAAEIAPSMPHPVFGVTIAELLRNMETTKPYLALLGPPGSGKMRLAQEITAQTGCRLVLDPATDVRWGQRACERRPTDSDAFHGGPALASSLAPPYDSNLVPTAPALGDSAGPGTASEIEFLACRSRLLAPQTWPEGDVWTLSDFWLAQSLAWCSLEHSGGNVRQVEEAYRACASQAVSARFVAALNLGGPTTNVADDFGERLRTAMRGLAGRGGLPPVLWLSTRDWEKAVVETLAVLAG